MPHTEIDQAAKRLRLWALVPAAMVAGLTFALVVTLLKPKPFDPLTFPLQTVETRVPGIKGPAVLVGKPIRVTGQKCSGAASTISVAGEFQWQSFKPAGTIVPAGHGVGKREPGCTGFDFSNPMPGAVSAAARRLGHRSVWIITGDEKPTQAHGVRQVWRTQPFTIVVPR